MDSQSRIKVRQGGSRKPERVESRAIAVAASDAKVNYIVCLPYEASRWEILATLKERKNKSNKTGKQDNLTYALL
jgi:hypothetical protein